MYIVESNIKNVNQMSKDSIKKILGILEKDLEDGKIKNIMIVTSDAEKGTVFRHSQMYGDEMVWLLNTAKTHVFKSMVEAIL